MVAGWGLLTPLGYSAWQTFTALLAGRSIADRATAMRDLSLEIDPAKLVQAVGSVGAAHPTQTDPTVELAERAAREACFQAGVEPRGLPAFVGTSKGAVQAMADGGLGMAGGLSQRKVQAVALGPCGYLSHYLQQRLGLSSVRHYVAACASSLVALHHARQWLLSPSATSGGDQSPFAIVLTADAALHPLFIHSYRRLGVLAPLTPEDYRQRPLDETRRGFMLAEAGAAVVLRRLPPGVEPDIGQIELVDTATACEANDLIRPSHDMPALRHVARRLLCDPRNPVDLLHPHAPGTPDHDPAELAAYADALPAHPPSLPDLYAAKGAIGHALGASGLVAFVLACLCATAGQRPPMPWLERPIPWPPFPDSPARAVASKRPCSRTGTHAIFAAGFAGHVAGARIRRW